MLAFLNFSPFEMLVLLGLGCLGAVALGTVAAVLIVVLGKKTPPAGGNLIPCPDCRRLVSRAAPSCPHCGRPLQPQPPP